MEHERFDAAIRALGHGTTRRGALGVLAGLAGLGLAEVAAKRRQRGHRHGMGRVRDSDAPSGKVTICHQTGSKKHPFEVITVAASAVPAHEAHGDLVSCPNLQAIDFATCTCVCPVADIVCDPRQHLDPVTCACVGGGGGGCDPVECEGRGDNVCTTCFCRPRAGCVCGTLNCPDGECIPGVGCP